MGIMGYDAMLTYGHHTGNSAGLRSAGSAADGGRAAVRPEGVAERGGPPGGSERARGAAVVSCVAGPGATGPKGRGARGPQAAAGPRRAGQGRAGAAAGSAGAWLCHGSLDPAAGGDAHSAADRGAVPSGARLVSAPGVELVGAASRAPGPGTRRGSDRAVEAYAVGAGKKNARRRRAGLVFEDESGLSHHPVVRRTWAPRGQPPILTHVGSNWKRRSIAAALAFRWDGHRSPRLLPDPPRHLHRRALDHVLARTQAPLPPPAGHPALGRVGRAQEPPDAGVPGTSTALASGRTLAGLCARAQPGRADLGQRQRARSRQPVSNRGSGAAPAGAVRLRARSPRSRLGLQLPSTYGAERQP